VKRTKLRWAQLVWRSLTSALCMHDMGCVKVTALTTPNQKIALLWAGLDLKVREGIVDDAMY